MFDEEPIGDEELDLSDAEGVRKAIHDIHERVKNTEEKDWQGQIQQLSADLVKCSQRLTELQANSPDLPPTEGEAGMRKYLDDKVQGGLRLRGYTTDDGELHPGLFDDPNPSCEWQEKAQQLVEQFSLVRAMTKDRNPSHSAPRTTRALERHMKSAPSFVRRVFADGTNIGGEWVPDVHLPVLERELVAARRMEALFDTFPVSDKETRIPYLTTGFRPYKKAGVTADDPAQYQSTSMVTDQVSITVTGMAVRAQVEDDASEDSIINAQATIRAELVTALVDGAEDCIINGDTAGTHQDTGIGSWDIRSRWGTGLGLGGSADHRRCWIGLRARAKDVSNETDQGAAQTYAGAMTARANLASPHGVAGDLIYVTSPEYWLKMAQFTQVETVDKFGPNAFVLTGQLGAIGGVPIVISEFVDKELNASGLYDNTTKTKTGLLVFNRARFKMAALRGPVVEVDKDITRGIINMVATMRKVFFTVDSSTKKNVHWSYNLTP